jgi:hypothetical protein
MKLTDTQLVLLSTASQREDCAIELTSNLRGAASHNVVRKLLSGGLIEEIAAGSTLPVWRRDENNEALALRITNEGLAAIQADEPPVEVSDASEGNEAADPPMPNAAPATRRRSPERNRLALQSPRAARSRIASSECCNVPRARRSPPS